MEDLQCRATNAVAGAEVRPNGFRVPARKPPMRAIEIRSLPRRAGRAIRDQLLHVEEKPVAVVAAATGATIVVSYLLAASVGASSRWLPPPRCMRASTAMQSKRQRSRR